jgi:hypothetical protein
MLSMKSWTATCMPDSSFGLKSQSRIKRVRTISVGTRWTSATTTWISICLCFCIDKWQRWSSMSLCKMLEWLTDCTGSMRLERRCSPLLSCVIMGKSRYLIDRMSWWRFAETISFQRYRWILKLERRKRRSKRLPSKIDRRMLKLN